jgi:ethanolamine ammonia-lyase small subunit
VADRAGFAVVAAPSPEELDRIVAAVVRALADRGAAGPHVAQQARALAQDLAQRDAVPSARPKAHEDVLPRKGSTTWRDRRAEFESEPPPRSATRPPIAAAVPLPGLPRLSRPEALPRLHQASPARIGIGRAGLRYPTDVYLTLRADHAVAKDAVNSVPKPGFVQGLDAIELHTQAKDLETFLLHPEQGRRLADDSLRLLREQGSKGADVQVIFADGLSAWAADHNAGLLPALQQALGGAGFSVGKPIWVHRARIAVADQIGVEMAAKATLICLGERPGLGTGDSLSIYLAWGPKVGQDNAEKNCISNVRPAGFSVHDAAAQAVDILTRAKQLGRGGLVLGQARQG